MQGPVLVVNARSSSIKLSGYAVNDEQEPALRFKSTARSRVSARRRTSSLRKETATGLPHNPVAAGRPA